MGYDTGENPRPSTTEDEGPKDPFTDDAIQDAISGALHDLGDVLSGKGDGKTIVHLVHPLHGPACDLQADPDGGPVQVALGASDPKNVTCPDCLAFNATLEKVTTAVEGGVNEFFTTLRGIFENFKRERLIEDGLDADLVEEFFALSHEECSRGHCAHAAQFASRQQGRNDVRDQAADSGTSQE